MEKSFNKSLLNKILIILFCVVLVLIIGISVINSVKKTKQERIEEQRIYNSAVEKMNAKDYFGSYEQIKCIYPKHNTQELLYEVACKSFDSTDYVTAYYSFKLCGVYNDSEEKMNQSWVQMLRNAQISDIIVFGKYEQSYPEYYEMFKDYYDGDIKEIEKNANDGIESVEWIVLERDEDKMLLLSKYALEENNYNNSFEACSWYSSDIREYLNDWLFELEFSEDEEKLILPVRMEEYVDSPEKDKLFLLSENEVFKYLTYYDPYDEGSDPLREKCSEYIVCSSTVASAFPEIPGHVSWLLRDVDYAKIYPIIVDETGDITESKAYVNTGSWGIRPAMWINIP